MWPHHEEEQRDSLAPSTPSFRVLIWDLGWNKEQEIHMAVIHIPVKVWSCTASLSGDAASPVRWPDKLSALCETSLRETCCPSNRQQSPRLSHLWARASWEIPIPGCALRQWYNSSREGCECLFSISSLLPGLLHLSTLCLRTSFLRWDMHLPKAQS